MRRPRLIVLRRELTVLSRRASAHLVRAVWLGAMLGVFWLMQASPGIHRGLLVGELMTRLFAVMLVLIGLVVPALVIQTIASETDGDTLGLLLLTNLTPGSILIQKLASRLWVAGLLILCPLPLLAALAASNSIPMRLASGGVATIAGAFAGATAAGLLGATLCRTRWRRSLAAYLLTAGWIWLWIVLHVAAGWVEEGRPLMGIEEILAVSLDLNWWEQAAAASTEFRLAMLAVAGTAVVAALPVASHRLQHLAAAGGIERHVLVDRAFGLLRRGWRWLCPLAGRPLSPLANPHYWLESRRRLFSSTRLLGGLAVAIVLLGAVLAAYSVSRFDAGRPLRQSLFILWLARSGLDITFEALRDLLLGLIGWASPAAALAIGIDTFAHDRRRNRLDLLAVTTMNKGYLVIGRYLACLKALSGATGLLLLAVIVVHLAIVAPGQTWHELWHGTLSEAVWRAARILALGAFALSVGLSCGAEHRQPLRALAGAAGWLAWWGGILAWSNWLYRYVRAGDAPELTFSNLLGECVLPAIRGLPEALASPLALVAGALLLAFHLRLAVLCLDPG